jgi:hypothetical protein
VWDVGEPLADVLAGGEEFVSQAGADEKQASGEVSMLPGATGLITSVGETAE